MTEKQMQAQAAKAYLSRLRGTVGQYTDVKQLTQQSYTVNAAQITAIEENVFNYFGVNKAVLQNSAFGDAFSAFYEGAIVPDAGRKQREIMEECGIACEIAYQEKEGDG